MAESRFLGLGKQLSGVLKALDVDVYGDPVWTLKQTSGKIYLDIAWTKTKLPADPVMRKENPATNCVQLQSEPKQLESDRQKRASGVTSTGLIKTKHAKRKNKSPSTRKRDQQRRERWLAKIRNNPSSQPISSPVVGLSESTTRSVSRPTGVDPAVEVPAESQPKAAQRTVSIEPKISNKPSQSQQSNSDSDLELPELTALESHATEPHTPAANCESHQLTALEPQSNLPKNEPRTSYNSDLDGEPSFVKCSNLECSGHQGYTAPKGLRRCILCQQFSLQVQL